MTKSLQALLLGCAALTACATAPEPETVPTPAVHELARLAGTGQLDADRMRCASAATLAVAQDIVDRLPALREAENEATRRLTSAHSRTVQDGMRASEVLDRAAVRANALRRSAQYQHLGGNTTRAAQYSSWAMSTLAFARERGEIHFAATGSLKVWSDVDEDLLLEYAELRAALATVGAEDAEARERVAEIEAADPVLMDRYAMLLLSVYGDAELLCEVGSL